MNLSLDETVLPRLPITVQTTTMATTIIEDKSINYLLISSTTEKLQQTTKSKCRLSCKVNHFFQ